MVGRPKRQVPSRRQVGARLADGLAGRHTKVPGALDMTDAFLRCRS